MNDRNAFFAEVFTRELNRWKKDQHKSQEKFAEEIHVEPNMITRYKQGKAYPSDGTLEAICRVLQVDKSVFYPQSFGDRLKYDKVMQEEVKLLLRKMEVKYVVSSNINLLFWEFLWQTIPNLKRLLPSSLHDAKSGFLFQKDIRDESELFDQSDLEYISVLQKDVINYIYMQTIKHALRQQIEKATSQDTQENHVSTEQEINRNMDIILSMILQDILRNPAKEDTNGID